jgi:hypothetical protein
MESERQLIARGRWVWAGTRRTSAVSFYFVAGRPQNLVLHRRSTQRSLKFLDPLLR